MKLYITNHGDPSVGIYSTTWEVDCPFSRADADEGMLTEFRYGMMELYENYMEGKVSADYDFESHDNAYS